MLKLQRDRLPMLPCQAVMLTLLLHQLALKRPGAEAITCGHKGIFSPRFSLAGYFSSSLATSTQALSDAGRGLVAKLGSFTCLRTVLGLGYRINTLQRRVPRPAEYSASTWAPAWSGHKCSKNKKATLGWLFLERETRFELATSTLARSRSTN
jgi:hypothetical protein